MELVAALELDAPGLGPTRAPRPPLRLAELARRARRADLATLRAALWALRACRTLHATEQPRWFDPPALPRVPAVGPRARRGVEHVLWLRGERCLVSGIVRQAWLAAHGVHHDLVIGVSLQRPGEVLAHAWLADQPQQGAGYEEITRVHPPQRA